MLVAVLAATAVAYWPSLGNGLTNWDDDGYVLRNPWLGQTSWDALRGMLGSYYKGNYHPLTMLSLWLDHAVSGGSVFAFHLVNGLLHLANTALVGLVAFRLAAQGGAAGSAGGMAIATAALFGLHPIHVESVAWVSERKDVLFAFFYLASLLAYLGYTGATTRGGRIAGYAGALVLFALSLLSKATAVSLAPTLVAVDWLLGRRALAARTLGEKAPFFALALAFGIVALLAQGSAGQLEGVSQWSAPERIALAGAAFAHYVTLLAVPASLSAFHPYPARVDGALPTIYWLGPVLFLAVQGACVYWWRRMPLVGFGVLFFTLNVALMLQLVPIGGALVAERYAYVASIGFLLMLAAGGSAGIASRPALARPLAALLVAYLAFLGTTTWSRTQVWRDSTTLWNDTLASHPDVPVARLNRALARHADGDLPGALADLDHAITVDPRYAKALAHRGVMRFQAGDGTAGLRDLDRALVLEPSVDTYLNRGAIRLILEDTDGALADLDRVVAANPGLPLAWSNRGLALVSAGRFAEAVDDFDRALALAPGLPAAVLGRAQARLEIGDLAGARADAEAVLAGSPGLAPAEWILGAALLGSGQRESGCEWLRLAATQAHPEAIDAYDRGCGP